MPVGVPHTGEGLTIVAKKLFWIFVALMTTAIVLVFGLLTANAADAPFKCGNGQSTVWTGALGGCAISSVPNAEWTISVAGYVWGDNDQITSKIKTNLNQKNVNPTYGLTCKESSGWVKLVGRNGAQACVKAYFAGIWIADINGEKFLLISLERGSLFFRQLPRSTQVKR